jgi:hypothetical protein
LIGFGRKNIKGTFREPLISQVRRFEMRHIFTDHALHPGLGQIGSPSPLNFRAAGLIAAPGNSLWLASASWQSAAQSLNDRTSCFFLCNKCDASAHRPRSCVVKLRFISTRAIFITTNAALPFRQHYSGTLPPMITQLLGTTFRSTPLSAHPFCAPGQDHSR